MENVVVIGMGYVGFPTACAIAKSGKYNVYGYDISEDKINLINKKISPIDDALIKKDFEKVNFIGTIDPKCITEAKFVLICVPTPVDDDFNPDLGPIIHVIATIKQYLKKGHYIILESTVNPGVCDEVIIPALEETGLLCGIDFEVGHAPERINPGDKKRNIYNISRNVGASTVQGTKVIAEFYRSFLDATVYEMKDIKHTEATKIVENIFRDVNIAFVNEIAKSFDMLGLDVVEVLQGASNKPFSFMAHYPGCGVGGHCIAVDPYYLIKKAEEVGFEHKLLKIARETNNSMPDYTVNKLIITLNKMGETVQGKKIGVLGLSYKADVADLRESPAIEIVSLLEKNKFVVETFEPHDIGISTCSSLDEILSKSEVLLVATGHSLFKERLSPVTLKKSGIKVIIDGRNCLDKDSFKKHDIIYVGVGR